MAKPSYILFYITVLAILFINVKADFDPDVFCTYVQNGTTIKDPRACNIFITCVDEKPIYGTCGDQFYDLNARRCVDPSEVQCYSSDPCARTPNGNGFASDPYSCNGYFYCANNVGFRGECNTGLLFNPVTQSCSRDYACAITMLPEDYCNIVPDGVYIRIPGSCSDFKMCCGSPKN